jgi:arylsulfatase A-like enzyme
VTPATVEEPVGQLDLAPTFCAVAGLPAPDWIQGAPLPTAPGSGRERVITEWDSQFDRCGMHLRTIYRDGLVCTVYEPSTRDVGFSADNVLRVLGWKGAPPAIVYDGSEGELYDLRHDPLQWRNLWDDPAWQKRKGELVADLYDHLPPAREPALSVEAPA